MTNLGIAQAAQLRTIEIVANEAGLHEDDFERLGLYKGKLTYPAMARLSASPNKGKLILVTAINPTPAGEGKTTVTIGLSQGLRQIGKKAIPATREPALGPVFGVKGGACGGGYSQVLPMEDINLFFTGDIPAVTAAHNLLSALIDAHIHHGNALGIDPRTRGWSRTLDMNDRALRQIVVGLGGKPNGYPREDGFIITPASEVMATLCLSRSIGELRDRLGEVIVGQSFRGEPVHARDLKANGAMAALLRDAVRPNLVQTIEGGPALVHGGPFGNIAHGCSSLIATQCGLSMADYLITEAGFGSELGAEKFLDIKCQRLGRGPDAIVLVATIRALKHHGGGEGLDALRAGTANLAAHIDHLSQYGAPVVVALNHFTGDNEEELAIVQACCEKKGVKAISADPWNGGGKACVSLAEEVVRLADQPSTFTPLYSPENTLEEKLTAIVTKAYHGAGYSLDETARKQFAWLNKNGFAHLPVCIAKTQYSLSDQPKKLNAPSGFKIGIRDLRVSAGAGFIVAVAGDIMLMPGLGKEPSAQQIDVTDDGRIVGLF